MDLDLFLLYQHIKMLDGMLSNIGKANKMFRRFVSSLQHKGKLKETMSHFRPEREEEDMFTSLWNLPEAHLHLSPSLHPFEKSRERAIKHLEDAKPTSMFESFHQTLQQFTKAIKNAPAPELAPSGHDGRQDETLANCYANRATLLMKNGFFEDCLKDIERASRNGFRHKKHLKSQKDRCLRFLGKEGVPSGIELMASKHFLGRPREKTFHERFRLYQQSQQGGYRFSDWFRNSLLSEEEKPKPKPKLEEPHPNIPTMSSAVRLAYMPEKGRHLVAARDIHPGELLIVEENYCSSLDQKEHETRCLTCNKMCVSAVPCPTCSYVIFCGEECRDRGLAEFHQKECKVLPTLATFSDETPLILAFRIFTKLTFPTLKSIVPVLKRTAKTLPEEKLGFDDKDVFNAADFRTVYHLSSNKHLYSSKMLMSKCAMAFVLLEILIASKTFFVDEHGNSFVPKQEDISLVGGTLVKVLMGLDNIFSLNELQVSEEVNGDVIKPGIGRKVCPTLSLLNHSCNPSVFSGWGNGFSWSTTIRFIPAGQEVTTSYTNVFYELEKVQRQEQLQNYYFTCLCEACEGNWPLRRSLSSSIFIRCLDCSEAVTCQTGDCRKCDSEEVAGKNRKKGEEILKAIKGYHKMRSNKRFLNGNYEEDKRVICKLIELLDKHAVMPCKVYVDAQEDLKIYFRREGKYIYVPSGKENSLAKYYWPPTLFT